MASPVSSTRSAARATYSAYKRQPIRWRLAGGSAALTLVILLGFAVIVGTLTTRAIYSDFNRQVRRAADRLERPLDYGYIGRDTNGKPQYSDHGRPGPLRRQLQRGGAGRRPRRRVGSTAPRRARLGRRPTRSARRWTGGRSRRASCASSGPTSAPTTPWPSSTARRISDVSSTVNRVKLFLGLGVLGGAALALLAGLATARRAMEPIAELTDGRPRGRAHARRVAEDPAPRGRRRGGRAGHHAGVDAALARRGARGDRGRAGCASASSSPTPRTSCARR